MEFHILGPLFTLENGLNPYYNGRYSWRPFIYSRKRLHQGVLILIIMEDTHGGIC